MRVIPELVKTVKEGTPRRPGPGSMGTIRVDIQHQEQETLEATLKKTEHKTFQFLADKSVVRGGASRGPTPLGYFVSGTGS